MSNYTQRLIDYLIYTVLLVTLCTFAFINAKRIIVYREMSYLRYDIQEMQKNLEEFKCKLPPTSGPEREELEKLIKIMENDLIRMDMQTKK